MMPIDAHRLYEVERLRGRAEIQRANEQVSRLASARSEQFRYLARHVVAPIRRFASWRSQHEPPCGLAVVTGTPDCQSAGPTDNGFAVAGGVWPGANVRGGYSQNGRSSNVPILAVGCRDETSIASSRSAHSRTL
jgi:hypothetical protein